jgi:cytochrome c553
LAKKNLGECCHGRTTTLTLLKRNEEIAKLKREHADEVKRLTQEMEEKRRQDKEETDKKLKLLLKAIMNQNVANFDMDAIATLISAPTTDANSEFHSLTSTHAPNDNEVRLNYILCLIQYIKV